MEGANDTESQWYDNRETGRGDCCKGLIKDYNGKPSEGLSKEVIRSDLWDRKDEQDAALVVGKDLKQEDQLEASRSRCRDGSGLDLEEAVHMVKSQVWDVFWRHHSLGIGRKKTWQRHFSGLWRGSEGGGVLQIEKEALFKKIQRQKMWMVLSASWTWMASTDEFSEMTDQYKKVLNIMGRP